ncbi:hypothetical protein CN931_14385 [Bacillus sp. AFS054943]|uniref:Uncharacterized protein n=1 Tax=Bacillus cereus TaxID=1396 RepID=A0A2C1LNB8_BACCE|nr:MULTISPECIES: hypothetical protein [Bacillus]PGL82590.1 hypothetical protein CN931_14385 [Bacillus sp. AFS054943]PGT99431.1 hypothetical protein COD19_19100 [Bacillus cereus]TKI39929.1 hypothetical protein FC700_20960 [Bacillus mycoides]
MIRKELLDLNFGSIVRVWYPDFTIKNKKYRKLQKNAVAVDLIVKEEYGRRVFVEVGKVHPYAFNTTATEILLNSLHVKILEER